MKWVFATILFVAVLLIGYGIYKVISASSIEDAEEKQAARDEGGAAITIGTAVMVLSSAISGILILFKQPKPIPAT